MAAEKYHFTRPTVTDDNVIDIVGGRHPLQELVVPTFIENDTRLVGAQESETNVGVKEPSVLLLTGANYSGKSVYLKQVFSNFSSWCKVALIVFLAHIGRLHLGWVYLHIYSFVPAQSAVIGITDKILTRVQTRESVSKVLPESMTDIKIASAFMIDVQQIALALRACTRQSLIIIDEFGKGTESQGKTISEIVW